MLVCPFNFQKGRSKVLHFHFQQICGQNVWRRIQTLILPARSHANNANNALSDTFSPDRSGHFCMHHFWIIVTIIFIIMIINIITTMLIRVAVHRGSPIQDSVLKNIFDAFLNPNCCSQPLSSPASPTRWATEQRAATRQRDSKPASSDMIKVILAK